MSTATNGRGLEPVARDAEATGGALYITSAASGAAVPLSSAQRGLWLAAQLDPGSAAYNLPLALHLSGPLDLAALQGAIFRLQHRHELLRARVTERDGVPMMIVEDTADAAIACDDFSGIPEHQRVDAVRAWVAAEAARPFRLDEAPWLRVRLARLSEDDHVLVLNLHHIAGDGASVVLLLMELGSRYEAGVREEASGEARLLQYRDFVHFERAALDEQMLHARAVARAEGLHGTPPLNLPPPDAPRPEPGPGGLASLSLDAGLIPQIDALCRAERLSRFTFFLTALQVLLARWSRQDDFAIGIAASRRPLPEFEHTLGLFINTVPVRVQLAPNVGFRELLKQTRQHAAEALDYLDVPLEALLNVTRFARTLDRPPLFQAVFSMQSSRTLTDAAWGALSVRRFDYPVTQTRHELEFHLSDSGQSLELGCFFSCRRHARSTIERLLESFVVLLRAAVQKPDTPWALLPLLNAAERSRQLYAWNDTTRACPDSLLHEMVSAAAAANPEAPAVLQGRRSITYAALEQRSDALAARIAESLAQHRCPVPVLIDRSIESVIAMLAVLKCGRAYVPLDPAWPLQRLRVVVEELDAKLLLTVTAHAGALAECSLEVLVVDSFESSDEVSFESPALCADAPACVIYTSGSTGTPRGVLLPHRSLVRLVACEHYVPHRPGLRVGHAASVAFDVAAFEVWKPLSIGGCCVVLEREQVIDPGLLRQAIVENRIELLVLTTALASALVHADHDVFSELDTLIFGGERCTPELVRALFSGNPPRRVLNGYGPTECGMTATFHEMSASDALLPEVPIGQPISNTTAFVLDETGAPVPLGVMGELVLGGAGVALGYLRAGEGSERFEPDGMASVPGALRFRTRDLVWRRADGALVFAGRADRQIKLRGYRIEPGEVEAKLCQCGGVAEAAVALRGGGESAALHAWITAEPGAEPDSRRIREQLGEMLPRFMVPQCVHILPRMPLTQNGKVDLDALDETASQPGEEPSAAFTDTETRLAQLWEALLGPGPYAPEDSFFDVGGTSLALIRLAGLVEQHFGRRLPVADYLESPTLRGMGRRIDSEPRAVDGAPSYRFPSVVPLRTGGAWPPLYLVAPAGGVVIPYYELAALLDARQPVFGLQDPSLDPEVRPLQTTEALAEFQLAALRAFQPRGPYRLAGWSFGGMVAFEMARRLEEMGKRVDRLILFDTYSSYAQAPPPPGLGPGLQFRVRNARQKLQLLWTTLDFIPNDLYLLALHAQRRERRAGVRRKLLDRLVPWLAAHTAIGRVLPPDSRYVPEDLPEVKHTLRLVKENTRASMEYVPGPYGGNLILFTATDRLRGLAISQDECLGWKALAADVRVIPVDSKHTQVLTGARLPGVAAQLNRLLDPASPDGACVDPG